MQTRVLCKRLASLLGILLLQGCATTSGEAIFSQPQAKTIWDDVTGLGRAQAALDKDVGHCQLSNAEFALQAQNQALQHCIGITGYVGLICVAGEAALAKKMDENQYQTCMNERGWILQASAH